ncbi:gamma-glutamyl-gamma-aminobutyrate hydrolase family protein [Escherichia coli]
MRPQTLQEIPECHHPRRRLANCATHAVAEPSLLERLLPKLDGIYLPGSPSNVQPHLYGENGDEPQRRIPG